jgi:hypothetical protein
VVYVPAGHGTQLRLLLAVGRFFANVPAGQLRQGVHAPVSALLVKVPLVQEAHNRSLLGPGEVTTYEPAAQLVQASQIMALAFVLWVPAGQGAQLRSARGEPEEATKVPGAQSVLFTKGVAGFPSSSHWSLGQSTRGAAPPAQNSPGLQAVQRRPPFGDGDIRVPTGQLVDETQASWFGCDDEEPAMQGAQVRSDVALGSARM